MNDDAISAALAEAGADKLSDGSRRWLYERVARFGFDAPTSNLGGLRPAGFAEVAAADIENKVPVPRVHRADDEDGSWNLSRAIYAGAASDDEARFQELPSAWNDLIAWPHPVDKDTVVEWPTTRDWVAEWRRFEAQWESGQSRPEDAGKSIRQLLDAQRTNYLRAVSVAEHEGYRSPFPVSGDGDLFDPNQPSSPTYKPPAPTPGSPAPPPAKTSTLVQPPSSPKSGHKSKSGSSSAPRRRRRLRATAPQFAALRRRREIRERALRARLAALSDEAERAALQAQLDQILAEAAQQAALEGLSQTFDQASDIEIEIDWPEETGVDGTPIAVLGVYSSIGEAADDLVDVACRVGATALDPAPDIEEIGDVDEHGQWHAYWRLGSYYDSRGREHFGWHRHPKGTPAAEGDIILSSADPAEDGGIGVGWLPGFGPSDEARKTYAQLRADWTSFSSQGVGSGKTKHLAQDVTEWNAFSKAWEAGDDGKPGGISSTDIGGRLNAEVIRANRVRAELKTAASGKTVFVQDLPPDEVRKTSDVVTATPFGQVASDPGAYIKSAAESAAKSVKEFVTPKFDNPLATPKGKMVIAAVAALLGGVAVYVATRPRSRYQGRHA